MNVAVIGVGHQGAWHAEKFAQLEHCRLLAVVDRDEALAQRVARRLDAEAHSDHRALFGRVDAVCVATPTASHFAIVRDFLERDVHVLVEKPLTEHLAQAQTLVRLAEARGLVLQGGHLERFNPAVQSVSARVREPRFIESLRIAPYKPRSLDVSVVLDLMIHDIDLVHSLVAAPISDVHAVGQSVFSDSIDIVNARLEFANGCTANITSSRISTKSERRIRVFEPRAYHNIDMLSCSAVSYSGRDQSPVRGYDDLEIQSDHFEAADALLSQAKRFLAAIATDQQPLVDGRVAMEALRTAERIHEQINRRKAL